MPHATPLAGAIPTDAVARAAPPHPIAVPRPPESPPPTRFPLVATIAPVVASLVMFAVTRSPYALVFAVLGPVVAVGGVIDSRLQRRRSTRRENRRFAEECADARRGIEERLESERARLDRQWPAPVAPRPADTLPTGTLPADIPADGAMFSRAQPGGRVDTLVRLGTGRVPSGIEFRVDRAGSLPGSADLHELAAIAAWVEDAPIRSDVRAGIAVVGDLSVARACARAIVLQLAALLPADSFRIEGASGPEWDWMTELPHPRSAADRSEDEIVFVPLQTRSGAPAGAPSQEFRVIVGESIRAANPATRLVVGMRGEGRIVTAADESPFRADLVSTAQARAIAIALGTAWSAGTSGGQIPEQVALADLDSPTPVPGPGLSSVLGRSARGTVEIDLVAAGPHAIIGGTTGSGKSELLLSWVLGMAARYPPAEVTFLFVDFKGGASFEPLAELPHSVGVVTDLDDEQSARALASLSAELRYRERLLAGSGRRSIDDQQADSSGASPLARLVVVVDEYAAVVDGDAALHRLFLDLAARGRSLGVHLILCTQRPSGVVREGILANAGLRISLRVTNGADSSAVVGTDAAAWLPVSPRGRAVVAEVGTAPLEFQVAQSTPADVARVTSSWSSSPRPRRPWCPPLPSRIPLELSAGITADSDGSAESGIEFGVSDIPEEQRRGGARWVPRRDGSLLVVGASGSGKSTALATLAAASSRLRRLVVEPTLPAVWDALAYAMDLVEQRGDDAAPETTVLLLDDLDAIVASAPADYDIALCDRLALVLRAGPQRGVSVAATVQRVGGPLGSALTLIGSRLLLRLPDRQEHLLAGGDGSTFSARLPPGGGWWNGRRTQVFDPSPKHPGPTQRWPADYEAVVPAVSLHDVLVEHSANTPVCIVSTQPERLLAELWTARLLLDGTALEFERVGSPATDTVAAPAAYPRVRVGEPHEWQADWASNSALRRSTVLFDSCSITELRAALGARVLPPPFPVQERPRWVSFADGTLRRVRG